VTEAEPFNDTHGKATAKNPMQRVVMAHRRHSSEQVFQSAYPHSIVKRIAPGHRQRWIRVKARLKIVDPLARILVTIAPLQPRLRVELEVIVRIDQAGQHEAAVEVDDVVGRIGRDVESVDASALDAQGPGEPSVCGDDLRV
jgi:hypothetical protein